MRKYHAGFGGEGACFLPDASQEKATCSYPTTKHSTDQWNDEMPADEMKEVFKRRIEEDGLHLTRKGRIVKIKGDLCYTPSANDVCVDPLIDGHIHPAQSAVPSYGDLDPDRSDVLGVPEMWIARPKAKKGSRIICIKSKANGFTKEELQDLSDLKEDLDNGFDFDEPAMKIALDEGSNMPINLEPDITIYENFFLRNARQAGFNVKKIDSLSGKRP